MQETDHGSFLQPGLIKRLLRGPAPWGWGGLASRTSCLDSKFLSQARHARRQTGTKCKFLLERGDVNTLVIFPMLISSAGRVEKAAGRGLLSPRLHHPSCGIVPTGSNSTQPPGQHASGAERGGPGLRWKMLQKRRDRGLRQQTAISLQGVVRL